MKYVLEITRVQKYLYYSSQIMGIFMILSVIHCEIDDKMNGFKDFMLEGPGGWQKCQKLAENSSTDDERKNQNDALITELKQMQSEQFQKFLQEQKKYENELKKEGLKTLMSTHLDMKFEKFQQFLNQQKKSENESREGLKKMVENHLDTKFENLATELKKNQVQQFGDIKSQQKNFITSLQNNSKNKKVAFDSKLGEFSEEIKHDFDKQFQEIKKNCDKIGKQGNGVQIAINNQTKHLEILQNLVLDLSNSKIKLDQAEVNIKNTETNYECKICMDKQLSVALKPCGHIVSCEDCMDKLPPECPLCRERTTGSMKVFLP